MRYTKTRFIITALFAAALIGNPTIHAQTKADYQALQKRLRELETTVQKLENAQIKPEPNSSASKIKLTDSITELKLYGDLRFRYQYDQADQQLYAPAASTTTPQGLPTGPGSFRNVDQRSRWRFRLRLSADFTLGEKLFGGVQLLH